MEIRLGAVSHESSARVPLFTVFDKSEKIAAYPGFFSRPASGSDVDVSGPRPDGSSSGLVFSTAGGGDAVAVAGFSGSVRGCRVSSDAPAGIAFSVNPARLASDPVFSDTEAAACNDVALAACGDA